MENRKTNAPGRPYLKGFVKKAIALAVRRGSCVAAAKELGIHTNTLRGWVRKALAAKLKIAGEALKEARKATKK